MKKIKPDLKKISDIALEKAMKMDICLPSDFLNIYREILEEFKCDINALVKEEIKKEFEKARKILEKNVESLENTSKIIKTFHEKIGEGETFSPVEIEKKLEKLLYEISTLKKEIYFDELTEVYNRKWLFHEILDSNNCFKSDGYIYFFDLNDFKKINDTYGHLVGDKVLSFFTTKLKQFLNKKNVSDYVFIRYAGDEFIIVSPVNIDNIIEEFQEYLVKKLKVKAMIENKEIIFKISFSYGSEKFSKGDNFNTILEKADKKMYENKKKVKSML